jgi:hypothetical protein
VVPGGGDLARSWIVGDRASDIAADHAAHCKGGILLSQRQDDPARDVLARKTTEHFAIEISVSLADAVGFLLARGCLHVGSSGRLPS